MAVVRSWTMRRGLHSYLRPAREAAPCHLHGILSGMKASIDEAGRLVIPKRLREQVGIRSGPVEVTAEGSALRIELPAADALVERDGRLLIAGGGARIDDATVRSLRDAGQRERMG